ncbi:MULTISPECIES: hypothetical protein [Methanobacterium]|nr:MULTISPECIES: hypothetical protein [Methanobacterium]KUK71911.1 MAG: hypothetical protein XD90_2073 [Methanobacterium sp. 42_16]MDG3547671.1 hypothetical protein [Methanobacterium formicicum]
MRNIKGGLTTKDQEDRAEIIVKLTRYKLVLEEERPRLIEQLFKYYHQEEGEGNPREMEDLVDGPKKVKYINYDNPYEAYISAQIHLDQAMVPILEQHIAFLEEGEDVDLVLESMEHSIYRVKKQTYTDVQEWEQLLHHLPADRLEEIENNPKGPGDLLLKELIWIQNYERKWMQK